MTDSRLHRCLACTGITLLALGSLVLSSPALAQDKTQEQALAKQLSNPIADLVSLPLQFNWAQGVGPDEGTRFILNVQPVVPFSVSKDWNMIMRVIMPFIGQPPLTENGMAATGLGDILASFFFSPREGSVIWGVGPVFGLPSTSERTLGSGKWAAGPTAVVLKQSGAWTYGALVNQVWSFAGSSSRADVSQFFVQPFLSRTSKSALTVTLQSETIANWKAADGEQWTVPINLAVAKLATFGPLPASYGGGIGYYVASPEGGPEWQLRGSITLILPKRR